MFSLAVRPEKHQNSCLRKKSFVCKDCFLVYTNESDLIMCEKICLGENPIAFQESKHWSTDKSYSSR